MQETRITKRRIQDHFAYSWWKYVLLACLAVFGWNLAYTSSAYRAPRDKRLDVTFVTYSIPDEYLDEMERSVVERYEAIEDASFISIAQSAEDDYYSTLQLTTYIGAGEGDIYIMEKDMFTDYAQSGTFIALDEYIASGKLDLHGIDPSRGERRDEEGHTAIYGIPLAELYGFMKDGIDNRNLVAGITVFSQTQDVAADWLGWLIESKLASKPQWLLDQEAKTEALVDDTQQAVPSY